MATKTYLEMVNEVLKNLREDTVVTVASSNYSSLVGTWINKSKKLVENAWQWSARQVSIEYTFPVSGSNTHHLGGASSNVTITSGNPVSERGILLYADESRNFPLAWDITDSTDVYRLIERSVNWVRDTYWNQNTPRQLLDKPIEFCVFKNNDHISVLLPYLSSNIRKWKFYFYDPQDDLSSDDTILDIPWEPVVEIATLWALNERGEEIGEPGTTVENRAHAIISDYIALDAAGNSGNEAFFPG